MARTGARKVFNDFGPGLVSEASPLNYPEGSAVSALNMIPGKPGEKIRRKGLALEENRLLFTNNPGGIDHAYAEYNWDSVASDPDFNLLVVQWGRELLFFVRDDPSNTLSPNQQTGLTVSSIDLRAFTNNKATHQQVQEHPVTMSDGNGELFVAGKFTYPFRVTWTGNDFQAHVIPPLIRDFRLAPDNLGLGVRPVTLSAEHLYNLNNQGWRGDSTVGTLPTDPIGFFFSINGFYPSNSDIYYEGLLTDLVTGAERFSPVQILELGFGNARAPAGHFFYDAQYPEYSWADIDEVNIASLLRVSGTDTIVVNLESPITLVPGDRVYIKNVVATMATDTSVNTPARVSGVYEVQTAVSTTEFTITQAASQDAFLQDFDYQEGGIVIGPLRARPGITGEMFSPDAVGFFSGRVWLGNVTSDSTAGTATEFRTGIFFSQLVDSPATYEKYYQDGDPTAQFRNNLVPTDGGFIPVAEIGLCSSLLKLGGFVLAVSDKGVWGVSGSENERFVADSYGLTEITEVGSISKTSAIKAEDVIFYWSDQGIYAVNVDPTSLRPFSRSVSSESIKDFYNEIPDAEKAASSGVFDKITKYVWWMHGTSGLLLNVKTLAWHPLSFGTSDEATPVGFAALKGTAPDAQRIKVATKFVLSPDNHITFADMSDRTFKDWDGLSGGGADAAGHIEVGYVTLEQPSLDKDVISLTTFMRKTEENWVLSAAGGLVPDYPSGCLVRAQFNWADLNVNGGYSKRFQAYRHERVIGPPAAGTGPFENGTEVITVTDKVNGSGKAISVYFETEPEKDCRLLGFALMMGADTDE